MSIILFVVVLVALIVVHEFGHFVAAKFFKMRVDEFGIGYPPRAWSIKKGETEYTLNWLPFGGFVKIHGEDGEAGKPSPRSFAAKPRWQQATVLVAGIAMNLVFAYVLLSITLMLGMPRALTPEETTGAPDAALAISGVLPGSPGDVAGLMVGDIVQVATSPDDIFSGANVDEFTTFIAGSGNETVEIAVDRRGEALILTAQPEAGTISADPERVALGIGIVPFGTVSVPWYQAPIEGAVLTWEAVKQTAIGLVGFFGGMLTFSADLSQVSGPVGIAGAVGDAGESGIVPLLTLTAIISINLALINLLPVPALDGGRLLFVLIETLTRKPIPAALSGALNFGGFALLILLMLVVTASDILKMFV